MVEGSKVGRRLVVAFAASVLGLAACSSDSASGEGEADNSALAVCGTAKFDRLPVVLSALESLPDADRTAVVDALIADGDFEGRDWQVVSDADQLVLFGAPTDSNFPYGHATFERVGDQLELQIATNCNLFFNAPGMNIASFRLDPDQPIDSASTSIPILFTEKACASGGALNGREVEPRIIEDEDRIEIIVLIEANDGPQDCPGNAEVGWVIELDAPVGGRSIADASAIPARELRG